MAIPSGTRLGRYEIRSQLGAGGMGEVYLAQDAQLERAVALKILPAKVAGDQQRMRRFVQEARAASALNHPNILTIYEIGSADGTHFIATEFIDGITLRYHISGQRMQISEVIEVAHQVANALSAAHRAGIVHRDIKPENIMLRPDGIIKVLDFGLAKLSEQPQQTINPEASTLINTAPGIVIGTVNYMSPEQVRGLEVDARTDMWSLGCVLYEMITGEFPFPGSNSFEVAASILKEEPLKVGKLLPDLTGGISTVITRLLQKEREKRYASIDEVKFALKASGQESGGRMEAPDDAATAVRTKLLLKEQGAEIAQARPAPQQPVPAFSGASSPTILVLPLEAVGSQEDSSFIGVGLAYLITTYLAKLKSLTVLSKAAGAGRANQSGRDTRESARELGATILLEGEVMRAGQVIRITARLIDVESGRVIWGSQYQGDESELFNIQDKVCESVASALEVSISRELHSRIEQAATFDINAFECYSKGRAFLERHDVEENIDLAIRMFEEALKLDSNFALAQAGLGEAYWLKYEATHDNAWVKRAISACDRALVLDPNQAQVHISLGIVYHGTGKIERAVEEFERAIELQPLSDEGYKWLGRCYAQKGETERAIECFKQAIEIRPGYWDNHNRLGICYYNLSRYEDAAEQFRRVITLQPDNYYGYNNLGAMYYLLGLYEDAVAMHQRAIEIHPSHDAYANLGCNYFHLGRYEEAIEAYQGSLKLGPNNAVTHRNLGDAYLRTGEKQEAEAQFRNAVKLLEEELSVQPNNAQNLGRLAICQAKLRDQAKAHMSIERAAELEPHDTQIMYQKAVVYALTGHADKAIEYLSYALAHGYSSSEAARDPDLEPLRDKGEYKSLFAALS